MAGDWASGSNSNFGNTTVGPNPDEGVIASITASVGDVIMLGVTYRVTSAGAGPEDVTGVTWNGESFSAIGSRHPIGPAGTPEQFHEIFTLKCASSATASVIITNAAYCNHTATVDVFTGLHATTWYDTPVVESEWDTAGYSNPALTVGSMASGDIIWGSLGASNYDASYADMSAVTWAPGSSETERQDIAHTGTGGHTVSYTKTGTGSVGVSYTPSGGNQPGFSHVAIRLIAAAGGGSSANLFGGKLAGPFGGKL